MPKTNHNFFQGDDNPRPSSTIFAVDESGDPIFYDKKKRFIAGKNGCSPILIMGCVYTQNPRLIRKAVIKAKKKILNDPLIVPFLRKNRLNDFFFHAKDDRSDVRKYFFEVLKELDFKARFVVARKNETIFRKRHLAREGVFYDDMVTKLFTNILYRSEHNRIYFSKRGKKIRQQPLEDAIQMAINLFESKSDYKIQNQPEIIIKTPKDEPLLEVVDYLNWAVYRAFTNTELGNDAYLNFILDKVKLIADVYDFQKHSWQERYYNHKTNKFSTKKISSVGLGAGISSLPHRNGGRSPLQG